MPGIDLHTHSSASDGELRPGDLVRLAAGAGLSALALTDHDTIGGLEEAREASAGTAMEFVPGCELSVVESDRQMHMVGLWIPRQAPHVEELLADQRASRHDRNRAILQKLKAFGVTIDYDEVRALAKGTVGRPHIAHILLERGVVKNYNDAFKKYLGRQTGRAYAPKKELPMAQAVDVLHADGALAILAHPYLLGETGKPMEDLARRYQTLGMDGLEAYYTDHSAQRTQEFLQIARKLNMVVSGGSDFHGQLKPQIKLGVGKGKLFVPESVLEGLKAYRREQGLWV